MWCASVSWVPWMLLPSSSTTCGYRDCPVPALRAGLVLTWADQRVWDRRTTVQTHDIYIYTHIHFELGFSVNAISRGKEWLNGKVESQRNCRCFNKRFSYVTAENARRQSGKSAASLRWEKVLGSIMRTTMEPTKQQQGGPLESVC